MSDRTIPILLNHNHDKVIGVFESGIATFMAEHRPTREQLFDIFGGAGIRVLEQFIETDSHTGKTVTRIGRCEIMEFSLCAQPTEPALR